jgi:hypothetical protein
MMIEGLFSDEYAHKESHPSTNIISGQVGIVAYIWLNVLLYVKIVRSHCKVHCKLHDGKE